jgi:hypothetical protein
MITGQVGLVPADEKLRGRIVAWAMRSYWCHMIVAVSETHCVSAEPGGARVRPMSDYDEICWSKFPMRPSQRRRSVRFALSRIGVPYAWIDWFAVGVALITRTKTPEWLRSFVADNDRLLCSQLADLSLQAAGIPVFFDERPAGAVTPGSFAKVFIARGWTTKK